MKCVTPTVVYSCNSASGTTCTKVTQTLPVINVNTTCVAADYVLLLQPEYAAMVTATTTAQNAANAAQTTANTANTSATAGVATDASQTTTINTLTTQLAQANQAIVALASGGGGSSSPNPDVIAAEAVIFGVSLTAVALIWGAKRIYKHFSPSVAAYE
jgi:hypothetical protein